MTSAQPQKPSSSSTQHLLPTSCTTETLTFASGTIGGFYRRLPWLTLNFTHDRLLPVLRGPPEKKLSLETIQEVVSGNWRQHGHFESIGAAEDALKTVLR